MTQPALEQFSDPSEPPEEEDPLEQELTDSELKAAENGDPWAPEPARFDGLMGLTQDARTRLKIPAITPSQFTAFAFRMPAEDGTYQPFSFEGRGHMSRPYDTPARRILLFCGRQVEKSTMLGNIALCYTCMVPAFKTLYVSPSATQTKVFSTDRIKEPIETSEVLRSFTTKMLSQNIFEKQFVNRSKITLRYAFLNADRTRGIPAYKLMIDELQDILHDNIPVIEQCTTHAPAKYKSFIYAGTPKSLDNTIETYRAQRSTQGEWVVPCDACGSKTTGRYWNVLGEKNIGKKGLICERCGGRINPQHPDAQWAFMVAWDAKRAPFESYRVPQLMVPWKKWDEVLYDYNNYPRDRFYNEVLGVSFDSGLRPLTFGQLKDVCKDDISMHPDIVEKYRPLSAGQPVFMGIDWGCHDDQTRILTDSGFKFFKELTETDKVAQWDPDTRKMTFVTPKVRTTRKWNKPLLHFKTRGGLDLMVTDTHRMRVNTIGNDQWLTESAGDTVKRGGNIKFVGHLEWDGEERATFVLPGVPRSAGYSGSEALTFKMNDWLELLGYMITEGGVCYDKGRPSCVKMSQRETVNHETYLKMQSCLDRMNIPFKAFPNEDTGDVNWTIYGKQFWKWYAENIGTSGDTKRIPREFLNLTKSQLLVLFQAMVDGDGYTDPREGCTGGAFYSTSKGLCEDFQELCIRLGLRCHVRLHKPAEGNRKTRWRALWSEGRDYYCTTPSSSVEEVPYDGEVYCCAVPSGYIVTERNGCVSYQGNTGENSYTVMTLGTYVRGTVFRIFYIHRFVGEEMDPPVQLDMICEMIRHFNVRVIGADYGGGFDRNDHLIRQFGPQRIQKYQYIARGKRKVDWDGRLRRWKVNRTEVMSDIFNAIKRKQFEFPRMEEFQIPYAQDMLNIFSEYNETLRMIQYDHSTDKPDDSLHSVLYCFLASMLVTPRPDIISPNKEVDNVGPVYGGYTGPTNQGLARVRGSSMHIRSMMC